MNNYKIERLHIEALILSCYLNQHRALEMDKMEIESHIIPYELFKASRVSKMIAKAIYNLQIENKPVDEILVQCYIEKHTSLNVMEYLEINSYTWCSYDTMIAYLKLLEEIDKEETKLKLLKGLM